MDGDICDLPVKPWCRDLISAKNTRVGRRRQAGTGQSRDPFRALLTGMITVLAIALVTAVVFAYREFATGLPPVAKLLDYNPPVATRVLAADGTTIGEFFIEKRYLTPIYKIPKTVQLAFLAAEDSTFYSHFGLDPVGILRAVWENFQLKMPHGFPVFQIFPIGSVEFYWKPLLRHTITDIVEECLWEMLQPVCVFYQLSYYLNRAIS